MFLNKKSLPVLRAPWTASAHSAAQIWKQVNIGQPAHNTHS